MVTDLIVALAGGLVAGVALWMRFAIVSVNKDMRAILDGQAAIRERLDALEGGSNGQ
jgi:hypothetical protein